MNWGRIVTAMVTPMKKDGSIDYDKSVALGHHLVKEGTTALLVCGTTGESPTITSDEKSRLFSLMKQTMNVPVIAGVGSNSTAGTIENIRVAEEAGVDGLLVVVPYYNKPNQESIRAHFQAVAASTKLPIMMYNVPGRTGVNMEAATSVALSSVPNIVALKEASGNLTQLACVVRDADDSFLVYTGEDAQILPTLAVGGYGVVSVASQVAGREIAQLIDHYLKGEVAEAAALHLELIDICETLFVTANPIPVKRALCLMGHEVGPTRLPLVAASREVDEKLRASLKGLGKLL